MSKKWFDVHFSLNGFMKIEANNEDEAMMAAEDILNDNLGSIEHAAQSGLGVEIIEAIGEDDNE